MGLASTPWRLYFRLGATALYCGPAAGVPSGISLLHPSLTAVPTLTTLSLSLSLSLSRAQFASVERLVAFTQLASEEEGGSGGRRLSGDGRRSPSDAAEKGLNRSSTTTRFPHTLSGWPRKGALELIEYRPAAYSPRVAPTLHPITLAVGEAEHVALVGRSGAGKSTLIAGLARLLPVDTGRMYIDGLEASEVPLMRWRKAMHAIPQEPLILAGTVLHNLEPSSGGEVEEVREEAAWEALRLAGLEDLVLSMPYGLHTHLGGSSSGEGGFSRSRKGEEGEEKEHYSVGLSGGQRQLLALARLLLHRADAKLVLLDEPAAGMEESASARLHAVIHERLHHATLLAITHRLLPLLHLFTRVVVLDHGVLVEDGAPTALLMLAGSTAAVRACACTYTGNSQAYGRATSLAWSCGGTRAMDLRTLSRQ